VHELDEHVWQGHLTNLVILPWHCLQVPCNIFLPLAEVFFSGFSIAVLDLQRTQYPSSIYKVATNLFKLTLLIEYMSDHHIDTLLREITALQQMSEYFGRLKLHSEYLLLIKITAFGLLYIFVLTKGWQRCKKMKPSGHDLLLLLYVSYIFQTNNGLRSLHTSSAAYATTGAM
jgi:hypothetical protein